MVCVLVIVRLQCVAGRYEACCLSGSRCFSSFNGKVCRKAAALFKKNLFIYFLLLLALTFLAGLQTSSALEAFSTLVFLLRLSNYLYLNGRHARFSIIANKSANSSRGAVAPVVSLPFLLRVHLRSLRCVLVLLRRPVVFVMSSVLSALLRCYGNTGDKTVQWLRSLQRRCREGKVK